MSEKVKSKLTTLNSLSIFSQLSSEQQQQIIDKTSHLSLKSGETLIKEGDRANTLYFLEQGRMVVFSGEKPIAEILPGESIGEIAFLNGGSRTATVIASRNCKLLQLDKKTYHTLINDVPELTQSIIKSLADRLTANNISISELEPKASNIVALLPAGDCVIPDIFIDQLFNLENEISHSWKIINANDLQNIEELSEWIQNNEDSSSQLILVATDTKQNSEMASAMANHADKSFLIVDNTLEGPTPVSSLEQNVFEGSLLNNIDLVIIRKDNSIKITDTSKILNGRQTHLHHHVALDHQPDLERLQRFIAGRATGLVLCGGGAFGTAHLGMIKALQEHGYNFDILGGTSAGSAMAALCALGYSPDDALIQLEEMFINKKSFRKYSIPFYSFIDHKNFDSELKRVAAKNRYRRPTY